MFTVIIISVPINQVIVILCNKTQIINLWYSGLILVKPNSKFV